MKALRRITPHLRHERPSLIIAGVCMIVYALSTAFYAFISGPLLKFLFTGNLSDVLLNSQGELRSGWKIFPSEFIHTLQTLDATYAALFIPTLLVIAAILKGLGQAGQFYFLGRIAQGVLRRVRQGVFTNLLRQAPEFFNKRSHGDLLSRLTNDANHVEQAMFYGIGPLVREPLVLLFLLSYLFYSDPKLAMVTFITIPIAAIPLVRFTKWLKKVSTRGQVAQASINATSYEALAGVQVVQAFSSEAREATRLETAGWQYYRQMLTSYFIRAIRTPIMEVIGALTVAGLLAFLSYQVRENNADAAHYMSFLAAFFFMYDPLKRLGRVADYLATGEAAAERLLEITELTPSIKDAPHAVALPPFSQEVRFENVSFAYGTERVLHNLSLTLPAGQMVALVGSSGSGKTTIANLLPRFWDINEGSLRIDGVDIRDLQLSSLRSQLSIVSQDTFLFNTSIRDNIAYGVMDASDEAIVRAAQAAHAHTFIQNLPEGYDTVVGERGVMLSGGQRQRLSIARALLRNTPLLILDEATSALDIESERHVQAALETLMRGRTSLVIAHRLSTVRKADKIAVLKNGAVIEEGVHQELLDSGGEYAQLYTMQFDEEVLPEAHSAAQESTVP